MAESISFTREVAGFIKNHKALCVMTLGLAIVAYSVTKLGGRGIAWLKERFNTSKKVEETTKEIFENKNQAPQEPKVSLPPIQQVQKPEKITEVSQPILLPKTPEEQLHEELKKWCENPNIGGEKLEAAKRIKDALRLESLQLKLDNLGLTELPRGLGQLKHLRHLDLDGNKLTRLPNDMGTLDNLISLFLNDNQFDELPVWLCNFVNIKILTLADNPLSKTIEDKDNFFKAIRTDELRKVFEKALENPIKNFEEKKLQAENKQKEEQLTRDLKQWEENPDVKGDKKTAAAKILEAFNNKYIRSLDLSGLGLTELPDCLEVLRGVKRFYLNDNKLTRLPESMGEIANLETLNLFNNAFDELPAWIGKCDKLKTLELRNNPLSLIIQDKEKFLKTADTEDLRLVIDEAVKAAEMKKLSNEKTKALLEKIEKKKRLEEQMVILTEDLKQWEENPNILGNKKAVTEKILEAFGWVSYGMDFILSLDNLGLTELPESVGLLTTMSTLSIRGNTLTKLPKSLGSLINLEELRLSNNLLKELPGEIDNCKKLRSLDLENNQLESLPETLGSLSHLEHLQVSGNMLKGIPKGLGTLAALKSFTFKRNDLFSLLKEEHFLEGPHAQNLESEIKSYLEVEFTQKFNDELDAWGKDPKILGKKQLAKMHISNAFSGRESYLDLEGLGLNQLPECIGYLTDLTSLNLKGNKLTELPKSMTGLNQINDLDLESNCFTHLPEQISSYSHLNKLSLKNNKLEDLGKGIGRFMELKALDLAGNKIKELPEEMGGCKDLELLYLSSNQLKSLPEWVKNFNKLKEVDLSFNLLEELPKEVESWIGLERIILGSNPLKKLPKGVSCWGKLNSIDLSLSGLEELPEEVKNWSHLTTIDIQKTPLKQLPKGVSGWVNLVGIKLSGSGLEGLPEEVKNWNNLVGIQLQNTPLKHLPKGVSGWVNLEGIYLDGSALVELPEEVKSWSNLIEIHIKNTPLKKLPKGVGEWKKLIKLELENNQIEELPDAIGKWTSLQSISILNTPIHKLPASLGKLKKLKKLTLSETKLQSLPKEIGFCSALERLWIKKSPLNELPASMGNLTVLQNLAVSEGNLTTFPKEIGKCSMLEQIDFSSNQITELPEGPFQWSHVTDLNLSHNRLVSIPDAFQEAFSSPMRANPSIRYLHLSYNKFSNLPSFIGDFTSLVSLHVEHNLNLSELPESFGNLRSLEGLSLLQDFQHLGLHVEGTLVGGGLLEALRNQWRQVDDEQLMNRRLNDWKSISKGQFDIDPIKKFKDKTNKANIELWLQKLENTEDFSVKSGSIRKELAKVVLQILLDAVKDNAFGEIFFAQLSGNLENCQDRSAMALNELYTAWEISKLDPKAPIEDKLKLTERAAKTAALRNAIGKRIATWQKQEDITEVEESVEIYLYYETFLKDQLNLLSVINGMSYENIGKRDWINVDDLKKEVEKTYLDELTSLSLFESICKEDEGVQKKLTSVNEQFRKELEKISKDKENLSHERTVAFQRKDTEEAARLTEKINGLEESLKQIPFLLEMENRKVYKAWYLKRVK